MRAHPALALVAWLLLALVLQAWSWPALSLLFLFCVPLLWRQLCLALRRMRWLLLTLLLVTAWSVPGDALFAAAWSPSRQGLALALQQQLRLLLLMASLRCVWLQLGQQGMLQALAWLLQPLALLGLPLERVLLRLGLTLFYAEHWLQHPPALSLAAWRAALAAQLTQAPADEVKLGFSPWTMRDTLALLLLLLLSGLLVKVGQ